MDADDEVDGLGDLEVGGGGEERQRLGAADAGDVVHVGDGAAHAGAHGLVERVAEADDDRVGVGLPPRRGQQRAQRPRLPPGQHRCPQGGAQRGLERGERDLAVALGVVGVTDVEPGAVDLDRQEQAAAGAEVADVEVAAVVPGRRGRSGGAVAGGDADQPEERPEVEAHRPAAVADDPASARGVDRGQHRDDVVVLLGDGVDGGHLPGEDPAPVAVAHDAVPEPRRQLDGLDAQHAPDPGAGHRHGADHRVGPVVGQLPPERRAGEVAHVVEQLVGLDAPAAEERHRVGALVAEEALVADGVEGDRAPVADGGDRGIVGRGQPPPAQRGRAGGDVGRPVDGPGAGVERGGEDGRIDRGDGHRP